LGDYNKKANQKNNMEENQNKKLLTEKRFLEILTSYNQEVLLPAMDQRFVTKNEFKDFKGEFKDFKNKTLTGQDEILKKLEILLQEKIAREYQEKKQKKMWTIIIKALKEHNILSSKELTDIAQLEIF